jgi:taurine dioxygenase
MTTSLASKAPARSSAGSAPVGLRISPIAGALGAEIEGVDLSQPFDDATLAAIRQALLDHLVIFFRGQKLTPETHKALGRRFGTLNIHPQYEPLPGHPEILPVVKEPSMPTNIGGAWHSDLTFLEAPPLGSLLYALEVPEVGGDTMFANQYLAYEALSDGMKAALAGLRAVHSGRGKSEKASATSRNATRSTKIKADAIGGPVPEAVHPVVRTHPETGRKLLFINRPFVIRFEGMTEEESRPLIHFLADHAVRPEFTCRFRWTAGALAFWDNRSTQHFALNDYPNDRRVMHRVTVDGDRPR